MREKRRDTTKEKSSERGEKRDREERGNDVRVLDQSKCLGIFGVF